MRPRAFALAFALLAASISLAHPVPGRAQAEQKPTAPAKPTKAELYRLRSGDEISVSVTPQKEYDCGGSILPDGRVYLKTIGALVVEGLTVPELELLLRKKLDEELVDPVVRVAIVRLAPPPSEIPKGMMDLGKITLVGAVGRAGPMMLEPGLRLRKRLYRSGGAARDADLTKITIFHPDLTRTIVNISTPELVSNPKHNILLSDGDSVEVPLLPPPPTVVANPVRIAGQITNQGQYELKQGMTLEDLLILAGRPTTLADLSRVELRRLKQEPQYLNLLDQRAQGLNGSFKLEPGDVVYIPEMKDQVLLIGAVSLPGSRGLKPGMTVRQFFLATEQASSINPGTQNLDKVRIIRQGLKEPLMVDVDGVLKKPNRKDNIPLLTGDVIYITPRQSGERGGILNTIGRWMPAGWLFGFF